MLERDDVDRPMSPLRVPGWRRLGQRLRHLLGRAVTPALSLRARLVWLVLAVALPGTVASLWTAWGASEERQARQLRDDARALAMSVDRELAQRATLARVLALSGELDHLPSLDAVPLQRLQEQAARAMQGLEGWVQLNTADEVLFSTRGVGGDTPAAAPPGSRQPRAPGASPLANRPVVDGLVEGQALPPGVPAHVSLLQPVERRGQVLANVEVTLLPQEIRRLADRQELPPGWRAAVLDSRGQDLTHVAGADSPRVDIGTWPALQAQMQAHDEALFRGADPAGAPVTAFFSTSPQGWSVLLIAPPGGLGAPAAQPLVPILVTALVLMATGIAGALWLSRRIARPLDELTSMAQSLQSGRPLRERQTGIAEWDNVSRALVSASETMRQARSELERRVSEAVERTRANEQLSSRSQRIAALGRLTGGVAHDFNNLLGIISNSAHLIQRHVQAEGVQVPLGAIRRSVEIGSRLTQHLLRFAGQQSVHPQALDLASMLNDLRVLLSTVLGKRVELSMDLQPGLLLVTVDPSELELALINIALNARDALNSSGRVHFALRYARPEETQGLAPGEYVLIEVADNGPGIPADILPRVFEPFFTSKPAGRATGLGLSQVLGFCVQAGGTACIASPPEGGTVVSLLLPATQNRHGTGPAGGPPANGSLAGARVLLVEDNEELSRITASLLRSFSCQVICVFNADEALRRFGTGAGIDVVLSDVMMPGRMDGPTLVQALRALRPELPAVLISGYSDVQREAPGVIILRKPCSPSQLLDALRRAMASHRPSADAEAH